MISSLPKRLLGAAMAALLAGGGSGFAVCEAAAAVAAAKAPVRAPGAIPGGVAPLTPLTPGPSGTLSSPGLSLGAATLPALGALPGISGPHSAASVSLGGANVAAARGKILSVPKSVLGSAPIAAGTAAARSSVRETTVPAGRRASVTADRKLSAHAAAASIESEHSEVSGTGASITNPRSRGVSASRDVLSKLGGRLEESVSGRGRSAGDRLLRRFWDGLAGRVASIRPPAAGTPRGGVHGSLSSGSRLAPAAASSDKKSSKTPIVESKGRDPAKDDEALDISEARQPFFSWKRIKGVSLRTLKKVFQLEDTPKSIAKGVALGVLIGMTPTVGIQWLAVLILSKLLKANMPAALSVIWFSNPLTLAPIYWLDYRVGLFLRGGTAVSDGAWQAAVDAISEGLFDAFPEILNFGLEIFGTAMLGGLFLGTALAIPLYFLTKYMVRRHQLKKSAESQPEP